MWGGRTAGPIEHCDIMGEGVLKVREIDKNKNNKS